jgi:hypothetical protein
MCLLVAATYPSARLAVVLYNRSRRGTGAADWAEAPTVPLTIDELRGTWDSTSLKGFGILRRR